MNNKRRLRITLRSNQVHNEGISVIMMLPGLFFLSQTLDKDVKGMGSS